ncbi:hypothetical protein [Ferrimonas marina]|uniref:Uncharacterized protein n=1 Tax=Ferrimonas marina TaxID=299255 RepID=A0A1M5U7U3_9GAMM|nr:hypothetical protein [Ferrimonas marina]SHH59125.1 hypothetical protein SAMN02745129_2447 [Ferrimonas marina]
MLHGYAAVSDGDTPLSAEVMLTDGKLYLLLKNDNGTAGAPVASQAESNRRWQDFCHQHGSLNPPVLSWGQTDPLPPDKYQALTNQGNGAASAHAKSWPEQVATPRTAWLSGYTPNGTPAVELADEECCINSPDELLPTVNRLIDSGAVEIFLEGTVDLAESAADTEPDLLQSFSKDWAARIWTDKLGYLTAPEVRLE